MNGKAKTNQNLNPLLASKSQQFIFDSKDLWHLQDKVKSDEGKTPMTFTADTHVKSLKPTDAYIDGILLKKIWQQQSILRILPQSKLEGGKEKRLIKLHGIKWIK